MEFIKAVADLPVEDRQQLRKAGFAACLQFAVDHETGYLKDCWARAQDAVKDLTTDLDRYHRLSDLAWEESAKLPGIKDSKEYGQTDYFVWGIRSMLEDLEPDDALGRYWREDFDAYVKRFHAKFGDCTKLGYCPCKKK
ncbi:MULTISPECIES: hypothetical protein [Streptomyces]|uniref:Uncharacterized protein n=1 Tax=Streptomyces canarius TaxID=285453 RepID=A0ABQ3CFC0_9ACTN|nr:hypothetical protein [Streptomyces canarius]GHA08983.1 hypothetical protein GCM10010345_11740 [Streptomyces canarius]